MGKITVFLGASILVFAFQNCSKNQFSAVGEDPVHTLSISSIENNDDIGDGNPPGNDEPQEQEQAQEQEHGGCRNRDSKEAKKSKETNAAFYVCILEGNGKSVKLGVREGQFVADNTSASIAACMSKNACETIVAAKTQVKAAYVRGFCKSNNPHVTLMSDAEVAAKVIAL